MPTTQLPKYEKVKRTLVAEIERGQWTAGEPIPSEAQLLQRFRVSRPTLVRSLQDLVREGYLYRRQGKGTFVAERGAGDGNGSAQTSVPVFTARHDAIGQVGEVLMRLLRGVQAVLGPAHIELALRYASLETLDEETRLYLEKTKPGVALMIEPSFTPQLRIELLRRGWTVWAVNEPWADGNCVYIDQERAGYLATQYLLQKGRRRIALINGSPAVYWGFGAKFNGYRTALRDAGIDVDRRLVREGAHISDTEAGRAMMRELLTEGIQMDGVVGASDSKAIGVVAAAQEAGLRVPDDLAVIGIDDILAARGTPPIPSVALPFEDVGRRAAEEALRHNGKDLAAPVEIQLKPTPVDR